MAGFWIVLAHEFLAQLDKLAPLVPREVPEPILIRGPERVDEHEVTVRVHGEFLLPVDVDEPPLPDLCAQALVAAEARLEELVVLGLRQARDLDRFLRRDLPVNLLELPGRLKKRLGQWGAGLWGPALRESKSLRWD